tara:strand:- start:4591 stop:4962 length:372 start_codon:yes stop_codon:yes gene_type:complete
MATADLSKNNGTVHTTNDSVVIVQDLDGLPGGRTLNVTGFPDSEISAGHVIIKETATGEYKPLPVDSTKPAGYEYVGYLVASLSVENAQAAITYAGTVNEAYCKYKIPAEAKTSINRVTIINE